jgi:hypothetical protein
MSLQFELHQYHFMGERAGGNCPPLLLKIEGGGHNSFAPLFGIKFKKKKIFTLIISMEAYIVHLAKGIRIFGQGYALKPL